MLAFAWAGWGVDSRVSGAPAVREVAPCDAVIGIVLIRLRAHGIISAQALTPPSPRRLLHVFPAGRGCGVLAEDMLGTVVLYSPRRWFSLAGSQFLKDAAMRADRLPLWFREIFLEELFVAHRRFPHETTVATDPRDIFLEELIGLYHRGTVATVVS